MKNILFRKPSQIINKISEREEKCANQVRKGFYCIKPRSGARWVGDGTRTNEISKHPRHSRH